MSWPWWATLVAFVPLALVATMVLRGRGVTPSAWTGAAVTAAIAFLVFSLAPGGVAVATIRGAWTGAWILLIVLPALLLYEILNRSGALDHLADAAALLAPTEGRRLLLLAWVLPSFLQGAAGFGAPIAMSAPLLVRRGMAPAAAVGACLIGYQWSVTFGSMGSSYFVAEATARLGEADASSFALRAAITLGISAVVSGLLVLRRGQRTAGDRWRALVIGTTMACTLVAVAVVQPALGSIAAGLAGLALCWFLLPAPGADRPGGGDLLTAALPYVTLTGAAVVGFAVTPVRSVLDRVGEIAPVLPGTTAAFGFTTAASPMSPVLRPLLHPMPYVVLAIVVALVAFHRRGWWPPGTSRVAWRAWTRRARAVGASILGLTILAALMAEAGMIAAIANALASTLGPGFVALSVPLGAFGTILTGSTTASNALFSSLQAEVATMLALLPTVLLVGQTAGGNIGNALAPATTAVGTAATGISGAEGAIIRRNLADSAILAAVVVALLVAQLWLVA